MRVVWSCLLGAVLWCSGVVVGVLEARSEYSEQSAFTDRLGDAMIRCIAKVEVQRDTITQCTDDLLEAKKCDERLRTCIGVHQ